MHLHFKGGELPEGLSEVIAGLTDTAKLKPAEIRYDPREREVIIPMQRYPVNKKRILGGLERIDDPVDCWLVVRKVETCDVQHIEEMAPNEEVQLIFGVQLKKNELHASSAEESRGIQLFSMDVEVERWDIELVDGT